LYHTRTYSLFPEDEPLGSKHLEDLTFVCSCIATIIVNDDKQDATILAYLFIPNQLYMFRAMDNIRTCKYSQVLLMMGEDIARNMWN